MRDLATRMVRCMNCCTLHEVLRDAPLREREAWGANSISGHYLKEGGCGRCKSSLFVPNRDALAEPYGPGHGCGWGEWLEGITKALIDEGVPSLGDIDSRLSCLVYHFYRHPLAFLSARAQRGVALYALITGIHKTAMREEDREEPRDWLPEELRPAAGGLAEGLLAFQRYTNMTVDDFLAGAPANGCPNPITGPGVVAVLETAGTARGLQNKGQWFYSGIEVLVSLNAA